jgi:CheY-like chemotaxis protein
MAKRILLVDENNSFRRKLGKRLAKAQFTVETTSDGASALEAVLTNKPDLVITNYHLPVFSGERLRAFIRNNPTTFHIPFVFLVNSEREKDFTLASIGPDICLYKPFNWEEISRRIEEAFNPSLAQKDRLEEKGAGVEGHLKEVNLVDLLQIFSLNRRTGILTIANGEESEGIIHLKEGDVVSTTLGLISGEKALYRILRWQGGTFNYRPEKFTVARNISRSIDALLMEGMRQLDEWETLQSKMPSVSAHLKLKKSKGELPKNLRPVTQEVILLLEFYETADQVIDKCNFTDYEICKALLGLIQMEIIEVHHDEKKAPREEMPLVSPDQALKIRKILSSSTSDFQGTDWGKILLFSPTADLIKEFTASANYLSEFTLARDNFSNQEIISASFGNLGSLSISEKTKLNLFALPSREESYPLLKPFSEGSAGAIFLTSSVEKSDLEINELMEYVKKELDLPVLQLNIDEEVAREDAAMNVFNRLFDVLLSKHIHTEE